MGLVCSADFARPCSSKIATDFIWIVTKNKTALGDTQLKLWRVLYLNQMRCSLGAGHISKSQSNRKGKGSLQSRFPTAAQII